MPENQDPNSKPKKSKKFENQNNQAENSFTEDSVNTEALNEGVAAGATSADFEEPQAHAEAAAEPGAFSSDSEPPTEEKVRLEFYGSDILREKAPKAMELADIVADEWQKDGQFQGLPVGSPVAQVAASLALRKAKDVEKRLEEKGVISMAKMGFEFLKSKIENKNS